MSSSKNPFSSEEIETAAPLQWPEVVPESPSLENSPSDSQLSKDFVAILRQDLNDAEEGQEKPPAESAASEGLAAMHQQVFEEAVRSGREAGYREGYDKGSQDGYKESYNEGFQQGYREGREKGAAEGRAEAKRALDNEVAYLGQLMGALSEPLAQVDDQVEKELTTLAMTVAKHLVRRELKTDPGQIVAVVREALAALPMSQRQVTLFMHPQDAELVRSALHLDEANVPWRIVEEPLISRGGCRVETEVSRIDATVETRMATVIAAALGGERAEDREVGNVGGD
ncbi:flagellar assembly protein FliH [Methylohalobius crimeensis]|uniref:flagellar assembly protein FliH n=1 Tax=Methylohalobius crimeensis TaxID=244365 RepID=UPI0003B4D891|nr:flagellar assembly protein FliH [Methylohalobius crimeensis]